MTSHRFTIYCHTNRVTGRPYVGQTVDTMEVRWKEHVSAAKRNTGCRLLGQAIREYGPNAFSHEVLEVVGSLTEADLAEVKWVGRKNSRAPHGYNLALGGNGPGNHYEESKRLIGESAKRRLSEMEPVKKSALFAMTIHRWTPERKAMAQAQTRSIERRDLVSVTQRKLWSELNSAEKSTRVKHQLAGMTREQKSDRVRKAWASLTPKARAERVRRAAAANRAASGPERSAKIRAFQIEQARLRTSEQRSAIVKKAWETRRGNIVSQQEAP